MLPVKSLRETLNIKIYLERPILDWREVPTRFFGMIYRGFSEAGKVVVHPNELSGFPNATTMGDLRVRWSIYGGASSVSLFTDRIEFDFPVLMPADYPIAYDILETVHNLIPNSLENWRYNKIESLSLDHLELPASPGVAKYLEKFANPEFAEAFSGQKAIFQPSFKTSLTAEGGKWSCDLTVDRSLFSAAAIFCSRHIVLNRVNPELSYLEKLKVFQDISARTLAGLGLEISDA